MASFPESVCPITHVNVTELNCPVIGSDGHIYEKEAIVEWLKKKKISPVTRSRMLISDLRTVWALMPKDETPLIDSARSSTIVLLDISSSMHKADLSGDSDIKFAQQALLKLANSMTTKDLLSVIVFSEISQTILPSTSMNRAGKKKLAKSLQIDLQYAGGSNYTNALVKAMQQFSSNGSGRKILILLTNSRDSTDIPDGQLSRIKAIRDTYSGNQVYAINIGLGNNIDSRILQGSSIALAGSKGSFVYLQEAQALPEILADMWKGIWDYPEAGSDLTSSRIELIRVLELILATCRKTANPNWYGQKGEPIEIFPGEDVMKEARGLLASFRQNSTEKLPDQLLAALGNDNYAVWGTHYIRSLIDKSRKL